MNFLEAKKISIRFRLAEKISFQQYLKKPSKLFSKKDKFTALDKVSFVINQGDILGVVGANGAGKTTLLRTLANIYNPDDGELINKFEKINLLSLGLGFQPRLTGAENIYLSGLAMGYRLEEIREVEKSIISFSELESFINNPVKTYSSGMYSKLSFSINVLLNSDLLLIDEVLSVGDIRFKKKSFEKLRDVILDDFQTVVIVSHSEQTILELCTKVMWLDKGRVIEIGEPSKIVEEYKTFMRK